MRSPGETARVKEATDMIAKATNTDQCLFEGSVDYKGGNGDLKQISAASPIE